MPFIFAHPAEETMMTSIEELESGSFSPNPLILDSDLVYQPLEYIPQKKFTEKKKNSCLNSLAFAVLFLTISFLLYSTALYITTYQGKTSPIETISQPPLLAWLNENDVTDLASRLIKENGITYLTTNMRFNLSINSFKNVKQLIRIKQGMKTIYDFVSDSEQHSVENGVVFFTPLTAFNLFMEQVDHITITYSLEVAGKVIDLESSETLKYAGNLLMDQEVYHPLEYIPESKKDRRWLIFILIAIFLTLSAAAIGFYLFAYIPHKEENLLKPEVQYPCSIYGPDFGPIEVNATILSIENGQVSYSASLPIRYLYCSVEKKKFYIQKEKQLISIRSSQRKIVRHIIEEAKLYDSSKAENYTFTDSFEVENIDSYNWLYEIVDITSHYKASLTENDTFASVVFYEQFFINFDYNQLREHLKNQKDEDFNEEYDSFDY